MLSTRSDEEERTALSTAQQGEGTLESDRRERILQAAVRVLVERGFPDTRIADVARAAGVSPALVIYYFGTKDRVLTEALRHSEDLFYTEIAGQLEKCDTAREKLELLIRSSCVPDDTDGLPGYWVLWLDLWAQAVRHPELARDRETLDQRWRDTIAAIAREGVKRGEFTKVDPDAFALLLSALIDGLAVQIALSDPVIDATRSVDVCMRLCAQQLGFTYSPRRRSGRKAPAAS